MCIYQNSLIVSIHQTRCCPNFTNENILAEISLLTHQSPSSTYQRTHACIICHSHPYTMNLNNMAPIASKISTNQQVWQDKYRITGRHKDLHGNPLRRKTTGSDEQAIHYEDEDTRGGSQQSWGRLQISSDFTLQWMDLVDLSLTPHISSLSLSTPHRGKNKSPYWERELRVPIWAGLPTLQRGPQSQRIIQMSP